MNSWKKVLKMADTDYSYFFFLFFMLMWQIIFQYRCIKTYLDPLNKISASGPVSKFLEE